MTFDSHVEKSPNPGINAAFDGLLLEARAGNLDAFLVTTMFSSRYRTQVPEQYAKTGGFCGAFGDEYQLLVLIETSLRRLCEKMDMNDRTAVCYAMMAATLGTKPPLIIPSPKSL